MHFKGENATESAIGCQPHGKAVGMDAETTIELITLVIALVSLVIKAIDLGTNLRRRK